eukprot:1152548-Pelagomonas_calceolata.AAC.2
MFCCRTCVPSAGRGIVSWKSSLTIDVGILSLSMDAEITMYCSWELVMLVGGPSFRANVSEPCDHLSTHEAAFGPLHG